MAGLIALGIVGRVPPAILALAAVAWVHPLAGALAAVVLFAVRREREPASAPAVRLVTVAAELRAGTGIRDALAGAVDDPDLARRLRRGRPWPELADGLRAAFGDHGPAVLAIVGIVRRAGGSAARLFGELAEEAVAESALAGERRAAAAPVLAQGAVVGGVPLLVLAHGIVSGRLADLAGQGAFEAGLVGLGSMATVAGAGAVAWILRRELRP